MTISYSSERSITSEQFVDVLKRSTLGERRPIDHPECIADMLRFGNLLCTAWDSEKLIGVARSVTDFSYCCYLSDLAVDVAYQKQGVGKELIRCTQRKLGPLCKIILLSAPAAAGYYPKIGLTAHPSAWVIESTAPLK